MTTPAPDVPEELREAIFRILLDTWADETSPQDVADQIILVVQPHLTAAREEVPKELRDIITLNYAEIVQSIKAGTGQFPKTEQALNRYVERQIAATRAEVERTARIDEGKGFPIMFERLLTKEYTEGLNLDMTGHGALDFVKAVSKERIEQLKPKEQQ